MPRVQSSRALGSGFAVALAFAAASATWQASAAPGSLVDSPWPTYAQNAQRTGASPFYGPLSLPTIAWRFARSNDHWGTDYRGTGIGPNNTLFLAAGMAG